MIKIYRNKNNDVEYCIDVLCNFFYMKDYYLFEKTILHYVKNAIFIMENHIEMHDFCKELVDAMYVNFNEYYDEWLKKNNISINQKEFAFDNHYNLLIANSSDYESMDDMLYELKSYILEHKNEDQKNEVISQLKYYKSIQSSILSELS